MNLSQFNQPESTVVITSFPNPNDGSIGDKGFNAVGWHSQKTLVELSHSAPVLVLAEKRSSKKTFRIGKNLTVVRQWKKGSLTSLLSLVPLIQKLKKVRSIFVQFEFNVFGGILPNLMLLFVLALLRLTGKHITFELHQVITDVRLLRKHVPITNPLLQTFFNLGLKVFYTLLGIIANDIVVFEETLKSRLSQFVKKDKIHVLCLSVEKKKTIGKLQARRQVNQSLANTATKPKKLKRDEFVVLVFGFINGYKGIDWIINALANKPQKNIRLLVAGGMNPYLKNQPHYQKLYNSIVTELGKHPHMTYAGFVPDEEVAAYFSAADVVALPYEVCMSASGPLSLALSYHKPVLLSEKLLPYAASRDVKMALKNAGLKRSDIFFPLTQNALNTRLSALQRKNAYTNHVTFSANLALLRDSKNVVKRLFAILHPSPSLISIPTARLHSAVAQATADRQN